MRDARVNTIAYFFFLNSFSLRDIISFRYLQQHVNDIYVFSCILEVFEYIFPGTNCMLKRLPKLIFDDVKEVRQLVDYISCSFQKRAILYNGHQ